MELHAHEVMRMMLEQDCDYSRETLAESVVTE